MIGNLNTSPLTEKSGNLIYQFYENKTDREQENILFIGLPKKDKFSLIVAVDILTRLLKNDIAKIKVNIHLHTLDKGDKIVFFGEKRAEFISFSKKYIHFYVKGYEYFGNKRMVKNVKEHLPILYGNYLKKYTGTANSYHYLRDILEKASQRRGNIGAKEELFLNDGSLMKLGVPSGLLKSKVILITGNGSKHKFQNWAEKIKIYGESISSSFNDNLVIEKDLSKFKDFFSSDAKSERLNYNNFAIKKLYELANIYSDLEDDFLELIYDFERGDYNESNLIELRDDIKALYGKREGVFEILINKIPKYCTPLPSGVKIVFIDSLEIVENYQNVINGLAILKIKVVCAYDLNDFSRNTPFPNSPRYFWTRERIHNISQNVNPDGLVDRKLYNSARRYSQQYFTVSIYEDDGFSELYWKIYNNINYIDGKENLVKLFWSSIHPIYYLIKNSPNIDSTILFIYLESLNTDLQAVLTGNSKIEDLFQEFVIKAKAIDNHKTLIQGNVYSQTIMINSDEINIPQNEINTNLTFIKNANSTYKNIIFSGIPYKEYQLKLVDNLIKSCSIPKIKFLCWEKEYFYLLKIIDSIEKSAWLQDNAILEFVQQSGCPICENNYNIVKVINNLELLQGETIDNQEYEQLSQRQSAYYHSRYKGSSGTYTKKAVTVYLKSNQWIYIPTNDNIYFINSNKGTISQKKGSNLNKSDVIILFNISKRDLREIESSNENMDKVFDDLEIWSNALNELFEDCNRDYNRLEAKLLRFKTEDRKKANPNRINLMRWLDDNDLTLAPREYNLEIILDAAGLLNEKLKILHASKKISLYERRFRKNIKKEIANKSNEFIVTEDEVITKELIVSGVSVIITACKVMSIDKEVLDIDNAYVKKLI